MSKQINQLIANHRDILAILFNDYNIQAPVNLKTVSAAIIAHSNDDGNPFLEDLSQFLANEFNNYEDILGLGKKAKDKRGGGKLTGGKILTGIGGIFKGKTKNPSTSKAGSGVFAYNPENPAEYSDLIKAANTSDPVLKSGIITEPKANKVTTSKVLDTISDVASAASNIFSGGGSGGSGGSGGGSGDDGSGDGGGDSKPTGFDLKKWALPILGGIIVLGGIIWAVTRPKSSK